MKELKKKNFIKDVLLLEEQPVLGFLEPPIVGASMTSPDSGGEVGWCGVGVRNRRL